MKQRTWLALLFLLAAGVARGEVYKWVDETGHVQFGDTPPPGSDAQPVQMHKVPTPEEVGRAKQRFDERLEQARKRVLGPQAPGADAPAAAVAGSSARSPQDAPCFAPLADFVLSPAGAAFAPITPTLLSAAQRATLLALMRSVEGHWEGRIEDVTCLGNPPAGEQRTVTLDIEDAAATWNPVDALLVVDSQVAGEDQMAGGGHGKELGEAFDQAENKRLQQRVEVHVERINWRRMRAPSLACGRSRLQPRQPG
jgi:hypothetical protein